MIKFFGFLVKMALFSIAVLILGNWIEWDGRTLNGHIQTHLTKAEKSPTLHKVKGWTEETIKDVSKSAKGIAKDVTASSERIVNAPKEAKEAAEQMKRHNDELNRSLSDDGSVAPAGGRHGSYPGYDDTIHEKRAHPLSRVKTAGGESAPITDIPSSERQKLKALIRDLNGSTPSR